MGYLVTLPSSLIPIADLRLLKGDDPADISSSDWKTYVLSSPAVWQDKDWVVTVPEDFMTDFASIPWMFRWWQTGGSGPQRIAAYFHDYLYSSQSKINRKESDRIFREVMAETSGPGFRRSFRKWAMWSALRVGGWLAWKSNQSKFKKQGVEWRMLTDGLQSSIQE